MDGGAQEGINKDNILYSKANTITIFESIQSSFKMDNSLEKTLFHLFWDILFPTELDIGCHRLASPSFSAWKCCPAIENTFSDYFSPFSESPYEEKGLQLGNLIMTSEYASWSEGMLLAW